ncbi:TonB-dependent receptor [Betaproteobacteria bacterium SCN1]|jgi:iron complex outermembrane receptor protein|nr:TonB-dependent receptor [Betaproteobacteria bacterium SCN1]
MQQSCNLSAMTRRLPTALPLLPALLYSAFAQGQEADAAPADATVLKTIEVSDTATPGARRIEPAVELDGAALTAKAAATLGETLADTLGVANSTFGPNVGLPLIRGQHGARTRVLIGGVGTHDAAAMSPDHGVTVEPLLAESIRVVKGPAVVRHGGGAIGGAVEIEDRRIPDTLPGRPGGAVQARYNANSRQRAAAAELLGGSGVLAWHVDAHARRSDDIAIPGRAIDEAAIIRQFGLVNGRNTDGRVDNTDAHSRGGSVGASLVGTHGHLGVALSRFEDDYGIPPGPAHSHGGGVPATGDAVRIDLGQQRFDVGGRLDTPWAWMKGITLRYGDSRYRHDEVVNGSPQTRFLNDVREARLEMEHALHAHLSGTLGFTGMTRDFSALGLEAFVPETAVESRALYLIETLDIAPWQVQLGARRERVEFDPQPQKTVFGPTVPMPSRDYAPASFSAALRHAHAGGAITLTHWLARRAPDVQELYALGPHLATRTFDTGASALGLETLRGWDIGLEHRAGPFDVRANVYRYRAENYIYQRNAGLFWDTEEELFKARCATLDLCLPVMRYAQQAGRFSGHEFEVGWTFDSSLLQKPRVALFGDAVRGRFDDGTDVPRLPPRRWGLAFQTGWQAWHGQLRLTRAAAQNRPGENETPTRRYTRIDLELRRVVPLLAGLTGELYVNARNLTDAEIRNSTSFLRNYASEPGRAIEAALRVDF